MLTVLYIQMAVGLKRANDLSNVTWKEYPAAYANRDISGWSAFSYSLFRLCSHEQSLCHWKLANRDRKTLIRIHTLCGCAAGSFLGWLPMVQEASFTRHGQVLTLRQSNRLIVNICWIETYKIEQNSRNKMWNWFNPRPDKHSIEL